MSKIRTIAVVVPCYNEEAGLNHLLKSLKKQQKIKGYSLDIILVNDGSLDKTLGTIKSVIKKHPKGIYYRSFAKNAGHQSALRAGLDVCGDYDAVIMLDADMQHPPELIPKMIAAWEDGASIVQMIREDSASEAGFMKYVTSKLYYKIMNSISSLNLEYGASDFRLIDQSITKSVIKSNENDLFLRGYFAWLPASRISITYKPAERFAGTSKYTFKKMLDLAAKGVMQFSEKPLQIAMNIGIITAAASILYALFLVGLYVHGDYVVSGWTSLMVVVLFCFGINFIIMGIIGQYLAHALSLQKNRPDYIVTEEKLPKSDIPF